MLFAKHRNGIIFILLGIVLILCPGLASAHANIVTSNPTPNQTLTTAPKEISIVFNEAVENVFHSIEMTSATGKKITLGPSTIDTNNPARLTAKLSQTLPDDIYTINWRVVSADGHPITGVIPFIMGTGGSTQTPTAVDEGTALPGWDQTLIRWMQYIGLSLYAGILLFHLYLLPKAQRKASYASRRTQWLLIISLILAAIGILLSLPLQAKHDAAVSWSEVFSSGVIGESLRFTTFGSIWWTEALLFLVLAGLTCGLFPKINTGEKTIYAGFALVTVIGLFVAKSFMGHAASADIEGLAVFSGFVHLAAASLWLGALLALAFLLPFIAKIQPEGDARKQFYFATIQRFSLVGTICVILLVGSGLYGIKIYTPSLGSLFTSLYGQVLLAKIALFLIMFGFAISGFLRGRKSQRELGKGVWIEFVVGIVVLILAAVLTNLPTALSHPGPAHIVDKTRTGYTVTLDISPNIMGKNEFKVSVEDPNGKPVKDVEQVTLNLSSQEMAMGTLEVKIPGTASPLQTEDLITMAGKWEIQYHILLKSLDSLNGSVNFNAGTP
ncbi:copper transport protein [Paenibacillus shirakamiensis]|uniref:Copper transport protein n=1 Tax=Paenibacillus shirakamiensis TaxID=1265935 RepID=A0ABS4JIT2_9BACL|nr:copper resistance protein CopC [Paenibacillus shirakamiensis]MBP2001587.1 copper transport protein [Paenibacillus shirakamiensis]